VQMADDRFRLFRSKAWWIGLSISAGIFVWNTLAGWIPILPAIPSAFEFYLSVQSMFPWAALGHRFRALYFDPTFFGFCYLIPVELLFSLLVFELLWLTQYVLSYYLGWTTNPAGFPFIDHQSNGGLLALAVAILWMDRHYLGQVLCRAFGLPSTLQADRPEALSYRLAVFGGILGLGYLWWFWARAGVAGWVVIVFLGVYYALAMMLSRIRAQVGCPSHEIWMATDTVMRATVGDFSLGRRALGMLDLLAMYLIGDQENNPTPFQLEALKMADGNRMERSRIGLVLVLVVPLTVLISFWAYLHYGYQLGLGSAKANDLSATISQWTTEVMASGIRSPSGMNVPAMLAMGFGAIVTWLLLFLHLSFPAWPLHPIAFPISNSYHLHSYTVVLFAVWLVKLMLLRYGGQRAYRKALPLFLGLIVGSVTIGSLVTFITNLTGLGH